MISRRLAQRVGLSGTKSQITLNTAGGGSQSNLEKEVVFQLVSRDLEYTSPLITAVTAQTVGAPFSPVRFNPAKHGYLKNLQLADDFPTHEERPFQILLSEPYFSMFEKEDVRVSPDPALPRARLTELGWVLRGALGITKQVEAASAFGVLAREHETFDLQTIYESTSFDFAKFWTGEQMGISQTESMTSDLTDLEIKAEAHHKQTAKFDPVKKQWTVCLPWINPEVEAHALSDNSRRVKALLHKVCLLYTSPSPRDKRQSRMPSSA